MPRHSEPPPLILLDPNQPSPQAMAMVKNRNAMCEAWLAKEKTAYDKQRAMSILNIDHERLDLKDFMKQVKKCNSDDLPEARHWLSPTPRKAELKTVRVISSAPESSRRGAQTRDIKTAPEKTDYSSEPPQSHKETGKFRIQQKRRESSAARLHQIFHRRAELVDCGPVWDQTPASPQSDKGRSTGTEPKASVSFRKDTVDNSEPEYLRMKSITEGSERTSSKADILVVNDDKRNTSRATSGTGQPKSACQHKQSQPQSKDFMRDLLVKNAKKRYRKRDSPPLENRLTDFYTRLDEWKLHGDDSQLSSSETRRRYLMLTQGVEAALAESSDDEDVNPTNTC